MLCRTYPFYVNRGTPAVQLVQKEEEKLRSMSTMVAKTKSRSWVWPRFQLTPDFNILRMMADPLLVHLFYSGCSRAHLGSLSELSGAGPEC